MARQRSMLGGCPAVVPRILGVLLLFSLGACNEAEELHDLRVATGDPKAGRAVIAAVECGICHEIPGVAGANGIVGPPLDAFADRQFIAGVLPNRPGILARWVSDAPSLVPQTGMPDLPLTEEESRDVAAYLYTLR